MNKLNLNHDLTFDALREINAQLITVLQSDTLDDGKLKVLIERRDTLINEHLSNLPKDDEAEFAKLEWPVNQALSKVIEKQLSDSLSQLSGLLRGKKAVNKYR